MTEVCTKCGHNITDKHCDQCIIQLASNGIVCTPFGVELKGYAAEQYSGPLLRPELVSAFKRSLQVTKPLVIQLLGFARAGKDFTATQLKSYYESIGKSVELYSYAAPMKRIAATLFGISLTELDEFKNNPDQVSIEWYRNGISTPSFAGETNFREFLQRLGNEAIKPIFGDAVWANLAQQYISKSSADIIIITDCRFNVELKAIGGVTVRVVNNSLPPPMQHASELELANVTAMYTLDNTDYQLTEQNIARLAQRILDDRL